MKSGETLINRAFVAFLEGDGELAEYLYLQAAKLGSGHAAHNLGVLYVTGAPGLEPDKRKAQYWLNFALEWGFENTVASDPKWLRTNV